MDTDRYDLAEGTAPERFSLFEPGAGIRVTAVNVLPAGLLIRFYEAEGKNKTAEFVFASELASVQRVDLLDREQEEEAVISGNRLFLPVKAWEIVTVKLDFC